MQSPKGARIFVMRRLPRDPFSAPTTAAADTWGLRSYASSPEESKPGEDVFDVYSLTPGKGLDGTAYREW